jgi:hypothetical protein
MEDKLLIREVTIAFENGTERDTSIRYFVEEALEDPEATVYHEGEEVTEIEEIEIPEVEA